MARKGQFKKGGGRHGAASKSRSTSTRTRKSGTTAIVVRETRTVQAKPKKRRTSRRCRPGGGGGGPKLLHLALATAGLAFATKSGATDGFQKTINEMMDKVPGTKTFGATAMLGIGALAVDRWVKPNKWLRLLGTAGIVLAAAQVGQKGSDFKFLGDDSTGDYNLEDVDDVNDVDDIGDDMGDDE